MRKSIVLIVGGVFACGALWSGGCAGEKNTPSIQALSSDQASQMNASRSEFEKSEDPPLTAQTHFAAAQLNETQGALPLAIEQYEKAFKLDPKCTAALFRLGIVYSQTKQFDKALDAWNRYVEATDHSAVGYSNLGYCQELAGDTEAAERSYQAGLDRDPASQPCRVNYGLMLVRQGKLEEAKEQFGAVLTPAERTTTSLRSSSSKAKRRPPARSIRKRSRRTRN